MRGNLIITIYPEGSNPFIPLRASGVRDAEDYSDWSIEEMLYDQVRHTELNNG